VNHVGSGEKAGGVEIKHIMGKGWSKMEKKPGLKKGEKRDATLSIMENKGGGKLSGEKLAARAHYVER